MQVEASIVYTVDISLLMGGNELSHKYEVLPFPMIKLIKDFDDRSTFEPDYAIMREMVYKRVDPDFFDSPETVDFLIEKSGGHPRHFITLLYDTFIECVTTGKMTKSGAEIAVKNLANSFRRFLEDRHYDLLARCNQQDVQNASEEMIFVLFHAALLEYNSFWRLPHPAIAGLPAFTKATEACHESRI